MTHDILLAGFGGQGILFAGKILAYSGLMDDKEVSWLPSYGPEMRGGTCNCSVCISDEPIGSPLVLEPSILIAMNTRHGACPDKRFGRRREHNPPRKDVQGNGYRFGGDL